MNINNTYQKLIERIIPIASIAFMYKDIINHNIEITELETRLLKASKDKIIDLKKEARKQTISSSYSDILRDLVYKEELKLKQKYNQR